MEDKKSKKEFEKNIENLCVNARYLETGISLEVLNRNSYDIFSSSISLEEIIKLFNNFYKTSEEFFQDLILSLEKKSENLEVTVYEDHLHYLLNCEVLERKRKLEFDFRLEKNDKIDRQTKLEKMLKDQDAKIKTLEASLARLEEKSLIQEKYFESLAGSFENILIERASSLENKMIAMAENLIWKIDKNNSDQIKKLSLAEDSMEGLQTAEKNIAKPYDIQPYFSDQISAKRADEELNNLEDTAWSFNPNTPFSKYFNFSQHNSKVSRNYHHQARFVHAPSSVALDFNSSVTFKVKVDYRNNCLIGIIHSDHLNSPETDLYYKNKNYFIECYEGAVWSKSIREEGQKKIPTGSVVSIIFDYKRKEIVFGSQEEEKRVTINENEINPRFYPCVLLWEPDDCCSFV